MKIKSGTRVKITNYPKCDCVNFTGKFGTYIRMGNIYHLIKIDGAEDDFDPFISSEFEVVKEKTTYQKFYSYVRKNLKLTNVEAIQAWNNFKNYNAKRELDKQCDSLIKTNSRMDSFFVFGNTVQGNKYWSEINLRVC